MSVHYKFKSALDYDTITFDGLHISVADLKAAILHQKRIGKTSDFDLQVTNAQTKEVYVDDHTLIPKNTSLVIARVPLAQQPKKSWDGGAGASSAAAAAARMEAALSKGLADLSRMDGSEEDKIKEMMSQSTLDYDPSNYQKLRGQTRLGEVPNTYRCHKCHQTGHWISDCPNANSESADIRRSTGIPRSFMVPVAGPRAPGAMMTPAGDFAVPAVDQCPDDGHQLTISSQKLFSEAYQASEAGADAGLVGEAESVRRDIPDDLLCSLCRDLLTDAIMVPCCGNSFCDECIRGALLESEDHECPDCREKDISPATLIPNRFLRNSVYAFRNQTGYSRRARPPPVKIPTAPEPPPQESNMQPQNGPPNSQGGSAAGGTPGAQQSHEDSDGSYEDNITVTVPPPQSAQLRSHPGPRPRLHAHAHTRPYGPPHGIRPMKPSGMDQPPPSIAMQQPQQQREERASTPTVDERRDPGMPNMQAMPNMTPMQAMPNMTPMQQPNMAYRPPGQAPYGMRPAAPMQQFMPYGGVVPGQQVAAGPPPRTMAPGQPGLPPAIRPGGPPLSHPSGPPLGHPGGPPVGHSAGPPLRHPVGHPGGPGVGHPVGPPPMGAMGPRPRTPFPGGPHGAFPRPSYQPSPPGIKDAPAPASGVDQQLEAFERMIREKAERARRRDEDRRRTDRSRSRSLSRPPRSRSPHSRDSSPRPIKRLSRSRSRAFSRSRSPRPIRSPRALRSPPRPPRSPRSLGRRSPPPPRRRSPWSPRRRRSRSRTRERSLSLSRSRSVSPRRRRSPPPGRFRSPPPLRSPPLRSPASHSHAPSRTSPHHRPVEPRRYPPSFEDGRVSPMRSLGQRPPPDPHYNPRYPPRNPGPPNYMPPVIKPIPMASDAPPIEETPPYRSRYPEVAFEDEPPGTQPPVPGFEDSPPFDKKDKLLPPGISERERPANFREPVYQRGNYIEGPPSGYRDAAPLNEIPPAFRETSGYREGFRDGPPLPYREGLPIPPYVEPLYREPNIPPVYRDTIPPTQIYREGVAHPYRNGPPQFRDGPNHFRNNPQAGFREAPPRSYRDGPPHNFRDSTFRPDHPNFRDNNIPDIRDMPQNYQDPNFRENAFREDGPPSHLRNRPAGREGHGYNRHNNFQNMRGNNRNPNLPPHDRSRDGPRQDREYRDRINARDAARELERTERSREVEKNERFERGDDRKERDKHRDRDVSERDRDKDRDRDRDNVFEKNSPDRRRRVSTSPAHRGRSKDDKLRRDRPGELRGHSREADPRKGDKFRKDDKVDDKHKEAKDKKIKERKKKKKEKDGDKKEKKRKDKKDKKEKEHKIGDDENKDPKDEDENKEFEDNKANATRDEVKKELLPPVVREEAEKIVETVDDLYKDVATDGIDETVIASYGQIKEEKDIQLQKQNGTQEDLSHVEEKDGSFDGIELQATAEELELKGECENIKSKSEVLAPVPELSKWEVDDDLDKTREPGEIVSPLADKSGKVTSEVLKRAENAIFAKAINAIRPIEIKRLSSDRAKLYSEEDSQIESSDKDLQALNNIQITVPVADSEFRSVEMNDVRKSRYEKTPPPKLSVKDRLGGKVDDPMKRRDDRMMHSTVERIKSRSKTPKQSDMTYRRITVEPREKGRRYVSKPEESIEHRMGIGNDRVRRDERRGQDRSNRYDLERRIERPDLREARHSRREHEGIPNYLRDREMVREDTNDGRLETKRGLSESGERHRRKEKKLRKEKEEKKVKQAEKVEKIIDKDRKDGQPEIENKSVLENKKNVSERDRKKSTLDEANFEPDYDETLESETENKDEQSKKRERSKTPPGQAEFNSLKKLKMQGGSDETANAKNAVTTDTGSSSGSESTSSSSSSDSDHKKRKKKRKKAKKKKSKRHVSESDSESDGSSSDEPKKKKKKKKHKKKADKKKKKKSKHK